MTENNNVELPRPSFLHGWSFLKFAGSNATEALPVQAVGDVDAPTILINTDLVSMNDLEIPFSAMVWVPLALQNLTSSLILEAMDSDNGVGFYSSGPWSEFRALICHHTGLTWDEILDLVEARGLDYMTEFAVSSILIESGLQTVISARTMGQKSLKLA